MDFDKHKSAIASALRGRTKSPLRDEEAAWIAIKLAMTSPAPQTLDGLIYALGLIYADQTGAMPGYTNSDNETRFERFAHTVLCIVAPKVTRQQLRSAIRRLNAKNNLHFKSDLEEMAPQKHMKAAE